MGGGSTFSPEWGLIVSGGMVVSGSRRKQIMQFLDPVEYTLDGFTFSEIAPLPRVAIQQTFCCPSIGPRIGPSFKTECHMQKRIK